MHQEPRPPLSTLQKILAPCIATFFTPSIDSQYLKIITNFLNPSNLEENNFKSFNNLSTTRQINIHVRDPRDGSRCDSTNFPIKLHLINDVANIRQFDEREIEGDLATSLDDLDENSLFNTVTELVDSKGYKIPIPKYSPWFDRFQSIIFDQMSMFSSDVLAFAGSVIFINADVDAITELGSLLTTEERCRINFRTSWLLNQQYNFKYVICLGTDNVQTQNYFSNLRQKYTSITNGMFLIKKNELENFDKNSLNKLQSSLGQSLALFLEKFIHQTYSVVQSKRTLSRSIFNVTKKFFGNSSSSPVNSPGTGDSNSGPNSKNYFTDEHEALYLGSKRLADCMLQCGMYSAAYEMYLQAIKDANSEKKSMSAQVAAEMALYSFALSTTTTIQNVKESEKLIQFMSSCFSKYLPISRVKAMRLVFLLADIVLVISENTNLGLSRLYNEIAKMYVDLSDSKGAQQNASSMKCAIRSGVCLEQAAILFAKSSWPRKYAFHMLLAGSHYSNSKKHSLHSLRCYRAAALLFENERLNSTFRIANQHISWTIARIVAELKNYDNDEALQNYGKILRAGILPGSDLSIAPIHKAVFDEYLTMLKSTGRPFGTGSVRIPKIINKKVDWHSTTGNKILIEEKETLLLDISIYNPLACQLKYEEVALILNDEDKYLQTSTVKELTLPPKNTVKILFEIKLIEKELPANKKQINIVLEKLQFTIDSNMKPYFVEFYKIGKPLVKTKNQRRAKMREEIRDCFKISIRQGQILNDVNPLLGELPVAPSKKPAKLQFYGQILEDFHFSPEIISIQNFDESALEKQFLDLEKVKNSFKKKLNKNQIDLEISPNISNPLHVMANYEFTDHKDQIIILLNIKDIHQNLIIDDISLFSDDYCILQNNDNPNTNTKTTNCKNQQLVLIAQKMASSSFQKVHQKPNNYHYKNLENYQKHFLPVFEQAKEQRFNLDPNYVDLYEMEKEVLKNKRKELQEKNSSNSMESNPLLFSPTEESTILPESSTAIPKFLELSQNSFAISITWSINDDNYSKNPIKGANFIYLQFPGIPSSNIMDPLLNINYQFLHSELSQVAKTSTPGAKLERFQTASIESSQLSQNSSYNNNNNQNVSGFDSKSISSELLNNKENNHPSYHEFNSSLTQSYGDQIQPQLKFDTVYISGQIKQLVDKNEAEYTPVFEIMLQNYSQNRIAVTFSSEFSQFLRVNSVETDLTFEVDSMDSIMRFGGFEFFKIKIYFSCRHFFFSSVLEN